jgi:hypothetical protein
VVDGLLAAAEMIEFVAEWKKTAADRERAAGRSARADELQAVADALGEVAKAVRARAAEHPTGDYIAVVDPGPGWVKAEPVKRSRRRTTASLPALPGSATVVQPMPEMSTARRRAPRRRKRSRWWQRLWPW